VNDLQWDVIGNRVRKARLAAGISARELARRIGVSASHVSQVERGIGAFSVPALYAAAREIDLSLHDLFDPPQEAAPAPAPATLHDLDADGVVQRAGQHPTIQLSDGPRWSRLNGAAEADAEFLEVIYQPGIRVLPDYIRHEGREYGIVISGALDVEVDGVRTTLHAGDSIVFDSQRPHRFWNESEAEVRAIWFVRDSEPGDAAPHA
jgi:transcriptional regulator with XRE-family HTH domain